MILNNMKFLKKILLLSIGLGFIFMLKWHVSRMIHTPIKLNATKADLLTDFRTSEIHPDKNIVLDHLKTSLKLEHVNSKAKSKPQFVIGILSSEDYSDRREIVRKTWLSLVQYTPFDMKYKFLLDRPTNATEKERRIYGDIIYLNVKSSGYAIHFAEKILAWFKFALKNYPNAQLIAKTDDDVYICTPQVFNKIYNIMSNDLYYGFQHIVENKILSVETRIDEMFVVLGRYLVEQFVTQKICGNNTGYSLRSCNFADCAIAEWMWRYKIQVNWKNDNEKMIHFDKYSGIEYKMYQLRKAKLDYCENNYLFHKSSATLMYRFFHFNKMMLKNISKGNSNLKSLVAVEFKNIKLKRVKQLPSCKIWFVTMARFLPTQFINEIITLKSHCLVIVGDENAPNKLKYAMNLRSNYTKFIHFLSPEDQEKAFPHLSEVLFWNHFGRRNIGYMYAIQNGAEFVMDVDRYKTFDLGTFLSMKNFYEFLHISECNFKETQAVNNENGLSKTWMKLFDKNHVLPQTLCVRKSEVQAGSFRFVPINLDSWKRKQSVRKWLPFASQDLKLPNYQILWSSLSFKYFPFPISVNETISFKIRNAILELYFRENNITSIFKAFPYVGKYRSTQVIARSSQFIYLRETLNIKTLRHMNIDDLYMKLFDLGLLGYDDIAFSRAWTKTFDSIQNSFK